MCNWISEPVLVFKKTSTKSLIDNDQLSSESDVEGNCSSYETNLDEMEVDKAVGIVSKR